MSTAVIFMSGALAMAYGVVAMFFVRFWRLTRDRLFACFAASFAILAIHRIALQATPQSEGLYLVRLAAFVIILIAIADKNRR